MRLGKTATSVDSQGVVAKDFLDELLLWYCLEGTGLVFHV